MSEQSKRMVITGATGLVGGYLARHAMAQGWTVQALTTGRSGQDPRGFSKTHWDPPAAARGDQAAVAVIAEVLDGADAVVNLAGAGVADKRLTEARKKVIIDSRVDTARALVNAWKICDNPPEFWFNASAIGYYGDTGDKLVHEDHPAGDDFLARVCVSWEGAARSLFEAAPEARGKVRQVIGRIGIVLARDAEAWKKMVMPIKMGVGGPLGDGQQYYPWVDADDVARLIIFLAEHEDAEGAFNVTAPEPVRQRELAARAASRLGRPSFMPAPAFGLKILLGEFAQFLLSSARVVPTAALALGFEYERPTLDDALDHLLQ